MPRKHHLDHRVFSDDRAARQALESLRWPNGPVCPTCSSSNVCPIGGEKHSHREGLYRCVDCRKQFTATTGTLFHGSKVPLSKWMQVIFYEANTTEGSWQMKQATGLDFKTIEKMRARIFAGVGNYRGPNTVFGRRVGEYVKSQRPRGYDKPPKLRPRRDGEGYDYRPYYKWREKHPLAPKPEVSGVLQPLSEASVKDLERMERLLSLLIKAPPVRVLKSRETSEKHKSHLGWLPKDSQCRRIAK